jgi:16S rRNA (guanine966-N2)-methyltransferase
MRAKTQSRQRVRIIGGIWRRHWITFPPIPGLRPSADRVRESLFNWLQPIIDGATCLDLFAGSGALGFEAASRGAASVTMVDNQRPVIENLLKTKQLLGAKVVEIVTADARTFLRTTTNRFDIIFLDPPFGEDLLFECCEAIETHRLLKPHGRVYLESLASHGQPQLPQNWMITHSSRAGQVEYYLASYA